MESLPSNHYLRCRTFPPVVHPRHARELLARRDSALLASWVGGYAITAPEHRQLLEELLDSLAWKATGRATLVHGRYGTGKSHLLVLLHLLCALPEAWDAFLDTHPTFRRYATALQQHRRVLIHFTLEDYAPRHALEATVQLEVERALQQAQLPIPDGWRDGLSRSDAWAALLETLQAHGYDGLVLLVDELSLFLAGKSPAQREADAAFLQFLADLTLRTPIWMVGTLQRQLADVGALRTHSWRQVEDRFRRYALSSQAIGPVLRDKLLERLDPAGIRTLVTETIAPHADAVGISLDARALLQHWPFHPAAIDLLVEVTNGYLSPHRSVVEVMQQVAQLDWLARPATRLITPLELFSLIAFDLQRDESLQRLWKAVALLTHAAQHTSDPALAVPTITLLTCLHLADRPATVAQLRQLLFDGESTPPLADLSAVLHDLRRRGAYLQVARDSDPALEGFALAISDDIGALALATMQEAEQDLLPRDPRITEIAMQACVDADWPLAAATTGLSLGLPWQSGERNVQLSFAAPLTTALITQRYEGLLANHADGHLLLGAPDGIDDAAAWQQATAMLDARRAGTLLLWLPRAATPAEDALWREYAAWRLAADRCDPPTTKRERQLRQRCEERAQELRLVVATSLRHQYLEGHWQDARGQQGFLPSAPTLTNVLAELFAPAFTELFPLAATLAPHGAPPRAAYQQLVRQFLDPGEVTLAPQSLLAEYLEQYAVPLGCVAYDSHTARLRPPREEIITAWLDATQHGALHADDAVAVLQRPPFGLSSEHSRLALFAAVRSGALQGLDAFLQPLDMEMVPLSQSDALTFVATPPSMEERHRPLVRALAARWEIPGDPWPLACCQVERRLRQWLREYQEHCAAIREAITEWSELLDILPWGWRESLAMLDQLASLQSGDPLMVILERLGTVDAIQHAEAAWHAAQWWQAQRQSLLMLRHATLPAELRSDLTSICGHLADGESAFPLLASIGKRQEAIVSAYQQTYAAWHDRLFGPQAVMALRGAFDQAEFRAVKALARLPLPCPEAAQRCLEALAQARRGYCAGELTQLATVGCCARCRLPFDSPSPMPEAAQVTQWAVTALQEYAALLATHPWSRAIRQQLPRAPADIAERAHGLFRWSQNDGAAALLAMLDERLLDWLCRERRVAGTRHVAALGQRLQGYDLTVSEARAAVQAWLDPEGALEEDTQLTFD